MDDFPESMDEFFSGRITPSSSAQKSTVPKFVKRVDF
jgi:hypothetical protein